MGDRLNFIHQLSIRSDRSFVRVTGEDQGVVNHCSSDHTPGCGLPTLRCGLNHTPGCGIPTPGWPYTPGCALPTLRRGLNHTLGYGLPTPGWPYTPGCGIITLQRLQPHTRVWVTHAAVWVKSHTGVWDGHIGAAPSPQTPQLSPPRPALACARVPARAPPPTCAPAIRVLVIVLV